MPLKAWFLVLWSLSDQILCFHEQSKDNIKTKWGGWWGDWVDGAEATVNGLLHKSRVLLDTSDAPCSEYYQDRIFQIMPSAPPRLIMKENVT